jgi:hypothetical protein
MTDFRMDTAFFEHKKTVKMQRRLGDHGVLSLVRLFRYASMFKTTGLLDNMDEEDIEIASGFTGPAGQFTEACKSLQWLDEVEPGLFAIHNWKKNNPWVAEAQARSDKARWNAFLKNHGPDEAARRMPEYAQALLEAGKQGANNLLVAQEIPASSTDTADNQYASSSASSSTDSMLAVEGVACYQQKAQHASSSAPFLSSPILSYPILSEDLEHKASTSTHICRQEADLTVQAADKSSKLPLPKHKPTEFRAFYAAYPRRDNPRDAAIAWDSVKPDEEEIDAIGQSLSRFGGKRLSKDQASGCKQPGAWLRARRWESTDPFPGLTVLARGNSVAAALSDPNNFQGGLLTSAQEIQAYRDQRDGRVSA